MLGSLGRKSHGLVLFEPQLALKIPTNRGCESLAGGHCGAVAWEEDLRPLVLKSLGAPGQKKYSSGLLGLKGCHRSEIFAKRGKEPTGLRHACTGAFDVMLPNQGFEFQALLTIKLICDVRPNIERIITNYL